MYHSLLEDQELYWISKYWGVRKAALVQVPQKYNSNWAFVFKWIIRKNSKDKLGKPRKNKIWGKVTWKKISANFTGKSCCDLRLET